MNDALLAARSGAPLRAVLPLILALLLAILALTGSLGSLGLGGASQPAAQTGPVPAGLAALYKLPVSARASVSAAIGAEDSYYKVHSRAGGAWLAENAGQHLSAAFTTGAVELYSHSLALDLSARAIGYGEALAALAPASPSIAGNRVTYRHASLSEWYANGPLGLEQGFTLSRRPTSAGRSGPLTLELRLPAGVRARVGAHGATVALSLPGHRAVSYADLSATDARGSVIPSSLTVSGSRLLLRVKDHSAVYPLSIDPLVQEGGILEGGPEEVEVNKKGAEVVHGGLGFSVALSANGRTALVGAPNFDSFSGAVWVFGFTAGKWTRQGKLSVPSEGPGVECDEATTEECAFGRAVAISADGNTAVVGGPRANGFAGAAWVFTRSGSEWTLDQELTAGPEENLQGRFGRAVTISPDGSTIAAGATADLNGRGAVYVFSRTEVAGSQPSWSHQGPRLLGEGGAGESHLGGSLALSGDGDTLLAGAPGDREYTGAAWLFARTGAGAQASWAQLAGKLTGGAEEVGAAHFGFSVALSGEGDTALIGARADDNSAGAAWVFTDSSGSWAQQGPKLTGGGEEVGEGRFGYSVALSAGGEYALIGAPHDNANVGAAWVFARSAASGTWEQQGEKLTSEAEPEASGNVPVVKGAFGTSVAFAANGVSAMIGSPDESGMAGGAWAFSQPAFIPEVRQLNPSVGPTGGGTSVRIQGERFSGVSSVTFGSANARFVVNADGSLTAIAPPHTQGSLCVIVTTPEGPSAGAHCPKYTYLARPRIETLTPHEGPTGGLAAVVISGHNFTDASSVTFGAREAVSFTVNSSEQITAYTPVEEEGEVPVTVTTPGGTATGGLSEWYLYQPPLQGVAAYTATACKVALVSHRVPVDRRGRARLKLTGPGSASCRGRLRLRARVKLKVRSGHTSRVRSMLLTIGTASFVLPAHGARTIRVTLNREGRALLRRGGGRLSTSVLIVGAGNGNAATKTALVQLSALKVVVTKASREARG